jgi:alpha-L-rhamnosidase
MAERTADPLAAPLGVGPTRNPGRRRAGAAVFALLSGVSLVAVGAIARPATGAAAPGNTASLNVRHLQVDELTTPLGIDDSAPKLSWQISGGNDAAVQTGYEVQIATSVRLLESGDPDLWDSGQVSSPQTGYVTYAGSALQSREHVFWHVRVWTTAGTSDWSAPSSWEMGLLKHSDWSAHWIEDPYWTGTTNRYPVFGKTFTVTATPVKARLYLTGLGMESAKINGQPIGDAALEPGETDYNKETQYRTYDVASLLQPGTNTIAIATGSGWYLQTGQGGGRFGGLGSNNGETGPPRVIGQLEITQPDGAPLTVATGPDWLTAFGPTTFSSWFGGEDYSAQFAQQIGEVPATANSTWTNAVNSVLYGTMSQATSATRKTTLVQSAAVGDTNVKVANVTGALVGAPLMVGTGATKESATITSVGTAAAAATTLATAAAAGDTTVQVNSVSGFAVGQQFTIDTGATAETRTVTNVGTAAVVAPGFSVTFAPALTNAHAQGVSVQALGSGITFSPALADAHAAGEAVAEIGPTTPRSDTPLMANPRRPVTVVATYKAVSITNPSAGVYVFDFGHNFSGWPVLNLTSPTPGQNIQIIPGEGPALTSAGLVTQSWSSSNGTRYDYVPSSEANQSWHPSFTYSGFRWLQVSGLSSPPTADTVYAEQLMTANPVASSFTSSTPLLNQIDSLVRRAEEANMESVLTDCPNREKGPYTGDTAQDIDAELNSLDMRNYLTMTERNIVK